MQTSKHWFSANLLIRWLPWLIFLLALLTRLLPGVRTIDDSFITYRYARNILAGNGFVYNPGEQVLGTTTPLYTFLMVFLALFTGGVQAPFAQNSLLVNALADAITCLLLIRMGGYLGSRRSGFGAALVWAIAPWSVTFAIGGLETSIYVLLLVSTVSAHLYQRHILAALLAALALLTRPDALILLGPLGLDRLWQIIRSRTDKSASPFRSILAEALAFLLPTLTWIIFAAIYFGSPLPHSIAAKTLAYQLGPQEGFVRLLQHYATPFLEHLTFGVAPAMWTGIVLYPFLFTLGARHSLGITRRAWPWLAYPWLYFLTFSLANPLIFRWYLTPPLPAYILTILLGADTLLTNLAASLRQQREHLPKDTPVLLGIPAQIILAVIVILTPTFLSSRDWVLHPDHGIDLPAPNMAWYKLELLYRKAAEELLPEVTRWQQKNGRPPLLAAGDVGVLGFYSGARILDTVGLNSPVSTNYYPADPAFYIINYAIPPDLILDNQPDFIIILEVYGRAGLLKDPRFWQAYRLREKISTDTYGSDGLLILEKIP